jgi:hypothetical protein
LPVAKLMAGRPMRGRRVFADEVIEL